MIKCLLHIALWLFLLLFSGCQRTDLTYKEQLVNMVSENSPYYREIKGNEYIIKICYLPIRYFELRNLNEIKSDCSIEQKQEAIETAREYYGNGHYFLLTLMCSDKSRDFFYSNAGSYDQWSRSLNKYLFRMGEFVWLETDEIDGIPLSLYHFERSYGLTKERNIIMSFPLEFNGIEIIGENTSSLRLNLDEFGLGIGHQVVEWDIREFKRDKRKGRT